MKYLDKIKSPRDIKKLSIDDLTILSEEIRGFLIDSISETGGHLASNLGVVELSIALHYCFNSPKDKLIWDVGHQAYVHKILTGRLKKFKCLRKYKGLSGFPKSNESIHDAFETGHSSTSISAALGYAVTRDLGGKNYSVVSIIGDGSISNGLAFEALNNAGRINTNIIVILNDNEMSISENVGALSRHLNEIRTAPSYLGAKNDINKFLKKVPFVGGTVGKIIEKTKDSLKYILLPSVLFEEMGFKYIGPIDGHNFSELINVLSKVRRMKGAVLLHVYTKKGKGYSLAEKSPCDYHGVESFDIETGKPIKTKLWDTYSDVFGKTICKLGRGNNKIVAITAAMPSGTGLSNFAREFPNRTFDVGIAESHAVTFAAGMAKNGFIPLFVVYSTFLQRSYDQIVHDVCMQNLHVIFAIDRAGIVGSDGETHQGILDLSFLSHIPNLTLLAPKNKYELIDMLSFAVQYNGPIAIRYPRGSASRVLKVLDNPIVYGKSEIIEKGEEIVIISVGTMMDIAFEVFNKLKKDNYSPSLVNIRFVKPIDVCMVRDLKDYKYIFVLEDNLRAGGCGSKILECMADENITCKNFYCLSFPDEFIEQGSKEELFKQYSLDCDSVYSKIKNVLNEAN